MAEQEEKIRQKEHMNNRQLTVLAILILLMVFVTIGSLGYLRRQTESSKGMQSQAYTEYQKHFAFVTDAVDDNFWQEIYEGAKAYGEAEGIYLEWTGRNLSVDYSKTELLQIAIMSDVDGILLEGDGSDETRALIDEAYQAGIPVVTIFSDSYDSKRQSFIGIGSYDLGREYGRQIVRIATKEMKNVLVLMDATVQDSGQSILFNGIKETLANEGNHLNLTLETLAVNEETAFGGEEVIREIFQKNIRKEAELPDIIVCLNEKNTITAYQAAVDYNMVGKVEILGYYVTDTILEAISREVIAATIAVDSRQMGADSVKALEEYIRTGHASDFVAMDVNAVTPNNVKEYQQDADRTK